MKSFWGLVAAIIAGAAGTLIAVVFEDDVRSIFADRPVTAHIYVSPWSPYPKGDETDPVSLMEGSGLTERGINFLTSSEDATYAAILFKNRGLKDIEGVRLQYLSSKPLMTVVGSEKSTSEDAEVVIPVIPAGGTVRVNVWSVNDLNEEFSLRMRAFSDGTAIPIHVHRHVGWGTLSYDDPEWVYALERWSPRIIFGLLLLLLVILVGSLLHFEAYVKRLFKDEAGYRSERDRYDADPKSFRIKLPDQPSKP